MVCLLNLPFVYRSSRNEIRHLFTVVYGHINETIGDFAKDTMNLSTFAAFFQILDLESVLYAPEPMQMFAPTDDAFDNLLRSDLNISLEDLLGNSILGVYASNGELFVIDRVLLPALANVPI